MIILTMLNDVSGNICGFECEGHAGYDEYGKDIVCAGVSALVLTCINSMEMLLGVSFESSTDEETGSVSLRLQEEPSSEAEILMESMLLGIEMIAENYKNRIKFRNKEV